MGGILSLLGGWSRQPQHRGVSESRLEQQMRPSGVILASMLGCPVASNLHCLCGFGQCGIGVGNIRRIDIVGLGEERCW